MDLKSPFILNKFYSTGLFLQKILLLIKAVFAPMRGKNGFLVRLGVVLAIGLFFTQAGYGATRYAVADGNWNSTATWSNTINGSPGSSIPINGDVVYITNSKTVTIPWAYNAACTTLNIASGATLSLGYALTVSGATTIDGTLNITQYNGTKRFTGLVTINSGGAWNNSTGGSPVNFRGGLTNNGSFTPGTGPITFTNANQQLNGNINFAGAAVTVTTITVTNNGTATFGSSLDGSGTLTNSTSGNLNIAGGYTNIGILNNQGSCTITSAGGFGTTAANFRNTGTIDLNGGGYLNGITNNAGGIVNFINAAHTIGTFNNATATSVLNISALTTSTNFVNTLTATVNGNTVNYTGAGDQVIKNTSYRNISISGGGTKTLGGATTVDGTGILTLTDGVLSATSNNYLLSVTNPSTLAISGGSATSYIDGPLSWTLPTMNGGGTYNFPVGDNGAYKPFSLVNPITSGTVTAQVEAIAANSGGTSADGLELSTAEYWRLTRGGAALQSTSVSLGRGTAIFPLNAIASSTTAPTGGIYTTRGGTANTYDVSNSSSITLSNNTYFVLGKASPTITLSTTALSGFTYAENNGPSTAQTFTVSGVYHTSNISVAVPANSKYELSTDNSNYSGNVNVLINAGGTASTTTIYVRLKAGLSVGTYNDVITASATDATSKTINLSGSVTDQPLITVTPNTLTGFGYVLGNGPSAVQTFTVKGEYLQGNITVTPPAGFEISSDNNNWITYPAFISLTPAQTATQKTIYVRLKSGLSTSTYNEDITLTASSATTKTVNCQGAVNRATINVSKFTLAGFIYTQGSGPSGTQTFDVSGTTLSANVVITAPTHFEIATSSGGTYGASISLTPSSGTISSTTIYVRMKSGYTAQTISSENITLTTTNAIQQNVACSGKVTPIGTAATISSNPTLNGFFYIIAKGPSIAQTFTVSGTSLGSDITVTAPANFEVSPSGTEGTYGASFSITPSSGKVNASPVYIRLKSGLAINTYTGNLTLQATGATQVNVTCNGKVVAQPTVVASPDPYNVCAGDAATLNGSGTNITSYYWTGPNGFSSNSQNPSLGTVTATNNGKYVVTGAVGSGVNLLTNGDFESGNTGFGSTYTYVNGTITYGQYAIVSNANTASPSWFLNVYDHTNPNTGKQMAIDGATSAGEIVWAQSVSVNQNTSYQFSYWVQNVSNQTSTSFAQLQLYVNNVPVGNRNDVSVKAWVNYLNNINSGTSTSLQLTLINFNNLGDANDFSIDDLSLQQIFEVKDSLTLTVNPLVTAAVSIAASQNPSLSGATVTYTATPTNGGTTPVYAWYKNGVLVPGETSSTYSLPNPTSGTTIYCILTSSMPCSNVATSNTISQTVNPPTNYWRGTNSTDWNTASNWTAGYVPAPGADVIFTSTSNAYGSDAVNNLVLDKDRTQGSIINASTKSLIIPAGKTLTANNSITFGTNPDKIQIQADATNPNGSLIFYSNNTVYATVEMYSKANINSSSTATNSKYKWQYFGIPVQTVATAEPTFFGSYVRKWVESGKDSTTHWVSLNNQSSLEAFKGYEITQPSPKKIYYQGILNNQDYTTPTLSYTSTVDYPGQHVLANSYTAALDIRRINMGSSTDQTIYLYNTGSMRDWYSQPVVTGSGDAVNPGQYVGVTPALAGQSGLPDRIPSMQGFVVKTTSADANSYINLSYQNSIVKNTTPMRVKSSDENNSENKLYSSTVVSLKTKKTLDKLWLFTIPETTNGFDEGYDVPKLMGSSIESELHSISEDKNYQINSSPNIHNSVIAVKFATDTIYTLRFEYFNQSDNYSNIYLFDAEDNKVIDITAGGSEYSFFAKSSSSAVPRFRIITNNDALGTDKDSNIKIFSTGGTVFVKNNSSNSGSIQLYDLSGRLVRKLKMDTDGTVTAINGLKKGYYVVNAYTDAEKNNKQVIVF